jgi:hypothetical protein
MDMNLRANSRHRLTRGTPPSRVFAISPTTRTRARCSYCELPELFVVAVVAAGFFAGGVVVFVAGAGCFKEVLTTAADGFWAVLLAVPACVGGVTAAFCTADVVAGGVVGRAVMAAFVFGAGVTAGALAVLTGMAALPTGTADGPPAFVVGEQGAAALAVVAGVPALAFFLWNNEPKFEIAWLALFIAPLAFWL